MPITPTRIGPRSTAPQARRALLGGALLVLAAAPPAAAAQATLVIDGKITTVDAIDGPGGRMAHAKAAADMALAAGAGLSLDAASGVVSIRASGGDVETAFRGFKGGVTFVVDGKIVKVSSKAVSGVPYVAVKDLKKVAEAMGFEADLDVAGGVLALTRAARGAPAVARGGGPAPGGTAGPGPGFGVGSDLMSVVAGAAGATGLPGLPPPGGEYVAPPHDGSVCGYMDSQKALWTSTEPSIQEKETVKRLADEWERTKKDGPGNPEDLELFERTLRGFNVKVQARLKGTRDSRPPPAAESWQQAAVAFLNKTSEVLNLSFDLIRVMKLPPDEQAREIDRFRAGIDRIKQLDGEHKALGTRADQLVREVRSRNRCGPP